MFDVGLLPLLLKGAGILESPSVVIERPTDVLRLKSRDPKRTLLLKQYLSALGSAGFSESRQGIWLQTEDQLLEANGGEDLHSGASLTKVATTLAVLSRYDLNQRFTTVIKQTGNIDNGVLKGDLVLEGGMDLLFMRPQAIALANQLQSLGINQVDGNLVILFPHVASLPEPNEVGVLLRECMNAGLWSEDTLRHYREHSPTAKKPSISIRGDIRTSLDPTVIAQDLLTHPSPTVLEMVKYMNLHSSNDLAESFVADMGGQSVFLETLLRASNLPAREIQLQNGSGLGDDNQMTPRAVVGMFMAIQKRLSQSNLDLKDAFPISGQDIGTLEDRNIPEGAVVKTGTLWNVSALAGYIPTQAQGRIWFAIMNEGDDYVEGFRLKQDEFLTQLVQKSAVQPLPSS